MTPDMHARAGGPRPCLVPLPASPRPGTRQTTLTLPPHATAPRTARQALTTALTLWGLGHHSDTAQQITTELVTNAVTASHAAAPPGEEPGPLTLTLSITARNDELCILVWDPDPTPPPSSQETPGDTTENGRGLIIVAALSQRWGSHPAPSGGKHTWATIPLRPAPAIS